MAEKRTSVDAYLASLADERRARLEDLRRTILAAAPDVQEGIAYNMPAYRLGKRFMVSFEAYKRWDSLFPASDAVIEGLGEELRPHLTGSGTIRFAANVPIPANLVTRIVRIRYGENAARARG